MKNPKVNIFINGDENVLKKGRLMSKSVENPETFPEQGIVFNMEQEPQGDMAKFLLKNGDNWYIPFRYISTSCEADYVGGYNYKYERFSVNIDGIAMNVGLRNEYYTIGEELSKSEMGTLCEWIDRAVNNVRNSITTVKSDLNQEAGLYNTNKEAADAAAAGLDGLKTQKTKQEGTKADLIAQQNQMKTEIAAKNKEIEDKNTELQKLKDDKDNLKQKTEGMAVGISAAEAVIKDLDAKIASGDTGAAAFQEKTKIATDRFNKNIASLKKAAPQATAVQHADDASKALLEKNSPKEVNVELMKITP